MSVRAHPGLLALALSASLCTASSAQSTKAGASTKPLATSMPTGLAWQLMSTRARVDFLSTLDLHSVAPLDFIRLIQPMTNAFFDGEMNEVSGKLSEQLNDILTNGSSAIRKKWLNAFGMQVPPPLFSGLAKAMPALIRDSDPQVVTPSVMMWQMLQYTRPTSDEELVEVVKDTHIALSARRAAIGMLSTEALAPNLNLLREALKHPQTSAIAARRILELRAGAAPAAEDLIALLKGSTDIETRMTVIEVLGAIGKPAHSATPILIGLLNKPSMFNNEKNLLLSAIAATAPDDPATIAMLQKYFDDKGLRLGAIAACAYLGPHAKPLINRLIEFAKDKDAEIQVEALLALGAVGPEAAPAVPMLLELLTKEIENERGPLPRTGAPFGSAPQFNAGVDDPDKIIGGAVTKSALLAALGGIGHPAHPALEMIIKRRGFPRDAEAIIATIAIGRSVHDHADEMSEADLEATIRNLRNAYARYPTDVDARDRTGFQFLVDNFRQLAEGIEYKLHQRRDAPLRKAMEYVQAHPRVIAIAAYVVVMLLICFGLLLLRPLWLLKLNNAVGLVKWDAPSWLGGLTISVRYPLFIGFFNHHPRVLDAWVKQHLAIAKKRFSARQTVSERNSHVPLPVIVDREVVPDLDEKHLQTHFSSNQTCILIVGEGGSGKTSLACKIATWSMSSEPGAGLCRHPMLPILIEEEIESKPDDRAGALFAAIKSQIQSLTDQMKPISDELLTHLLQQRRVLVIIDHLSECSEEMRKTITPGASNFPVNALVVTSRFDEQLGGANKTVLQTLLVEGQKLSSFMESYLTHRQKRELFSDPEYFEACSRLSTLVGTRKITVLFAKLYADQMIASKESADVILPATIPDLMLGYLNQLNHGIDGNTPDNQSMHQDLKLIAWECLKRRLQPAAAEIRHVLPVLKSSGDNEQQRLRYYLDRLRVISWAGPAQDSIRFTLDPLAEYLAAIYLHDQHGDPSDAQPFWRGLFEQIDSTGNRLSTRGFVLALRDAWLSKTEGSNWILRELADRSSNLVSSN